MAKIPGNTNQSLNKFVEINIIMISTIITDESPSYFEFENMVSIHERQKATPMNEDQESALISRKAIVVNGTKMWPYWPNQFHSISGDREKTKSCNYFKMQEIATQVKP